MPNVSTHSIGSDDLNMALILGTEGTVEPEMNVPSPDFRNLLVIEYRNGRLREKRRFNLPSRLSTNILYDGENFPSLWVGVSDASIIRIQE